MLIRAEARGKINWTLDVLGRRPDGYHELDTILQSVTLSDTLTFREAEDLSLRISCENGRALAADERNLVLRAARALAARTGCRRGAEIRLVKRVPMEAGMGGGSSDAAAALLALNRLWHTGLSGGELEALGLSLGADVPFCVRGGLARARGIGELLTDLPGAPAVPLLLIQPCGGLSTREVFAAVDAGAPQARPDGDAAESALAAGDLPALARAMGNALQGVSLRMRPELGLALAALREAGAAAAQMTGSGSVVFGAFSGAAARDRAAEALKSRFAALWTAETADAGVLLEEVHGRPC